MIEARNLGEGTADFNRQQQLQYQSTVSGKLGGFLPPPRMVATTADQMAATANKQLLMSKPIKPNTQIPPLDAETRMRLSQALPGEAGFNPKLLGSGPPAMIYAGFEGGMSLSQKNLEQARSKFLLDKLTGKLPAELKGGQGTILPPLNFSGATPAHEPAKSDKEVRFVFDGTGSAHEKTPRKRARTVKSGVTSTSTLSYSLIAKVRRRLSSFT